MPSRPSPRAFVPAVEGAEARLLLSTANVDNRVQVADTAAYPYSAIVDLIAYYPNGKTSRGSGAMLDRAHVLTAAHVVYNKANGGWPAVIAVMPGQAGATAPLGTYAVARETIYTDYATHEFRGPGRYNHDVALLRLSTPTDPGVGALGEAVQPDAFFKDAPLTTSGYPGDLPSRTSPVRGFVMYTTAGHSTGASSHIVDFTNPIASGQSGSPLYTTDATGTYIDGVVSYGRPASAVVSYDNGAVRMTGVLYADLKVWGAFDMAADISEFEEDALPHDPSTFRISPAHSPQALMHIIIA